MVTFTYKDFLIDFSFPGCILYDEEGKIIPSSHEDFEELNDETAWILISYTHTKIFHGDTCLRKASPIKYL